MKRIAIFSFLFLGIALLFTTCVKEKNFPSTPIIEFKEYVIYGADSADCIIKFKDGDGDIGIVAGDTTSKDDFKMKYLYKGTDGLFHPFDGTPGTTPFDTLYYSYRVPNITPDGQYKALDGEIKAKLRSAPLYHTTPVTVKFEITLRDRAGHLSNMVSTNEISIP